MAKLKGTILIATSLPFGTITSYFHHLARALVQENYRVVLVIDNNPSKIPDDEVNLFFRKWPSHRPTKWKDFTFFLNLLREFRPLLCLSNFGSTNIVSIASYFMRVPHRWNFVHTLGGQIRLDSGQNLSLKSTFLDIRKGIIYRLNTELIANSRGTRMDVIRRFKLREAKVFVHPFLIPQSDFDLKSKEERKQTLAIVGRLEKSKGHFELLSQFKVLLTQYPKMVLNIVGNGQERDRLEKEVSRLEIIDNVEFSGNISNDEIGKVYANSLAHISSSYAEAFGMVNIEALREGTPIICTRTSGSTDILKENINGQYFMLDHNESLCNSFKLINNRWKQYSKGALQTFDSEYNLRNMQVHIRVLLNKLK